MPMKKRFDFTKKNKRTGKIDKVGYLDLNTDEEKKKCSLYFYGDIVSETWMSMWYEEDKCPQDIADFLNQLDGYEDVDIYFNSGGGDVFAGIAIYNQLKRHEGKKTGYVDGLAASIASVIMFACDELHFASGAQTMVHKPSSYGYGNANDFAKLIAELDKCEGSIIDIYMEHVKEGVTREEIQSLVENETWMSGSETAEYFNVEIDEQAAVAACASDYFDKYNKTPDGLNKPDTNSIVDAVIEALQDREQKKLEEKQKIENKRIEDEKAEILADLDDYGV